MYNNQGSFSDQLRPYLCVAIPEPLGNGSSSALPLGNLSRDPAFPGIYFRTVFLPFGEAVENACRDVRRMSRILPNPLNADT
jgi:hypothetical protein